MCVSQVRSAKAGRPFRTTAREKKGAKLVREPAHVIAQQKMNRVSGEAKRVEVLAKVMKASNEKSASVRVAEEESLLAEEISRLARKRKFARTN